MSTDKDQLYLNNLKIGDKVTVYYDEDWRVGIILDIEETRIKIDLIHLKNELDDAQLWMKKTSQLIDCCQSYIQYDNLDIFITSCSTSDPIFYKNQFIFAIGVTDGGPGPGIYSYHTIHHKFNKIDSYPQSEHSTNTFTPAEGAFTPTEVGLTIDRSTDDLYIIGGISQSFAKYNLLTKKWDITGKQVKYPKQPKHKHAVQKTKYSSITYPWILKIQSMFYVIDNYPKLRALTFNSSTNKLHSITPNLKDEQTGNIFTTFDNVIFDEQREQILLFGPHYGGIIMDKHGFGEVPKTVYCDAIYYYDINGNENEWREYSVKAPMKTYMRAFYAFESIVFLICLYKPKYDEDDDAERESEIWCLELITRKWYKLHLRFPREIWRFGIVGQTDDGYIHFMNGGYGSYHVRIDLYQMIPKELLRFYSDYYLKLVSGYIGRIIIPSDLIVVIAKYHNSFACHIY